MMFVHHQALFALVAAAAPVVIYLLLRRRKTEVLWGAGYLLRLALASKKRTSLWRQMVVLATRAAILALAALLIAQPYRPSSHPSTDTPALPNKPVHRVILLDNSSSMTVTEDDVSRFDRAKLATGALLRSQRAGDLLGVIPLIPESPAEPLLPVTYDGQIDEDHVEHALASIPIRDGEISLESTLATAVSRLGTTPKSAGQIYLFSDYPRELENQIAEVGWFASLAKERSIQVVPVNMIGGGKALAGQNVSIDAASLGTDFLVAGVPTRLYVDASNHSDQETVAVFSVTADVPLKQMTVRLNPDEHRRISIPLTLRAGDGQTLTVSVRPTRIVSHGTKSLVVDVKDALNVWLAADEKDPDPDAGPDDVEFFQRAMKSRTPHPSQATKSGDEQATGVRLKPAKLNDLTQPIPEDVDAVIVVGPRYTTPAMAKPLIEFVRRGGGLIFTVSPSVHLPAFNDNLKSILPALLDKTVRDKVDPEAFYQLQLDPAAGGPQTRPSLFDEFGPSSTSTPQNDLAQARFYNHYQLQAADASANVSLRLSNGDPLIVEKAIGRGHVVLYASTLGVDWTSLPVRQSFIPLVTRILNAAVAGRTLPLNLEAGSTAIASWPVRGSATLTLPDQSVRPITYTDSPAGQFMMIDGVRQAGVYQLNDPQGHRRVFSVSGRPVEQDLRSLPESAMGKLSTALGSTVYANWTDAVQSLGPAGATHPIWPWLLAGILALYLFEVWFVRSV